MAVTITFQCDGRLQGKGGAGGKNYHHPNPGTAGGAGGVAFGATEPCILTGSGMIYGGGGGGGGGSLNSGLGGGGGGGAGTDAGDGGIGGFIDGSLNGQPGTADAGGEGGQNHPLQFKGGNGGGIGLPGSTGGSGQLAGGAAGPAISGVSFVTFASPNLLDIQGPQV